ncbi:zinc-dependent peptidase [Hydrogenophaga sp. MI9]|uniref:M90 family metallopeptidase n=1 Tax=Hydrogenophaga sp. MI9 TaxID=3453719 RepID=UPI003EED56F7
MSTLLPAALQRWLPRTWRRLPEPPTALWRDIVQRHPFLRTLTETERQRLKLLSTHFLQEKEFHGAHGLAVTDAMALTVAAQACLPLLHMLPPSGKRSAHPLSVLDWYGDFVGIVIQPGAAVARRNHTDATGIVHQYDEVLAGEAMDRGPIMLSWEDVLAAPHTIDRGGNLVIHEFAHKIDMHGMGAGNSPDGAPPLPGALWGTGSEAKAREHWRAVMADAYARFRESLSLAERFGGDTPWLDAYAATHPAEFFAVSCEAYFVNRERLALEFPALVTLYDGFFRSRP